MFFFWRVLEYWSKKNQHSEINTAAKYLFLAEDSKNKILNQTSKVPLRWDVTFGTFARKQVLVG